MRITVDNYTRVLLTVIAVLLLVVAVDLWCQSPTQVTSTASAGIPDSGQQLNKLIQKVDDLNVSLARFTKLLTSGQVKVQVVKPEEIKGRSALKAVTPPPIPSQGK